MKNQFHYLTLTSNARHNVLGPTSGAPPRGNSLCSPHRIAQRPPPNGCPTRALLLAHIRHAANVGVQNTQALFRENVIPKDISRARRLSGAAHSLPILNERSC